MRSAVLPFIALLTLGCVSAPPRVIPEVDVHPPQRWGSSAVEQAPVDAWWNGFDDPRLAQLVDEALVGNYSLRAAASRVDRAVAEARIAGADLKPSVNAGLGAARRRQNFIGLPIPGQADAVLSTTSTQIGLSLDIAWEADLWGRIRAGARAAVAETQAVEADLAGARLSIAGLTAKAWFSVVEAHQQVELARSSVESFRSSAEKVRARFRQGLRPAVELRLALSNQAAAEALLARRKVQLDASLRALEILMGRYPAGSLLDESPAGTMPRLPAPVPTGLPAELIVRRPDLVAAERRLAAVDQFVLQSRRALKPRFALTASGGTASDQLGDLLDGDFRVWSLLGNLVQPLFQGGRLRAGIEATEAGYEELLALYAQQALIAFGEVEATLTAERHLIERERHLGEAARQLAAARRLAEERYRSGLGDYLTVLESQTRELLAESDLLAVRRELLHNRIDLHLALGGGFDPRPTVAADDNEAAS